VQILREKCFCQLSTERDQKKKQEKKAKIRDVPKKGANKTCINAERKFERLGAGRKERG